MDEELKEFCDVFSKEFDEELFQKIFEQITRHEYGHVFLMINDIKEGKPISSKAEKVLESFFWDYVY